MKIPEPGSLPPTPLSEGDEIISYPPSEMSDRQTPLLTDGKGEVEDDDNGYDTDLEIDGKF